MAAPGYIDSFNAGGADLLGPVWPIVWTLIKIIAVLAPLMIAIAYATLWERKFIGWIQIRVGPNRVGPGGLLQPMADGLKLLIKEIVIPAKAITIESTQREDGTRRTSRYDIDLTKCIFCGFCEESCPVDSIVETHVLEYHGEKRGDLYYTKEMLLAVGDRYETEIAAAREADAKFR